ncbi:hypothetical protein Kisp01_71440 [Kineosporia sp. NBRC 101677]|uniref:hypothetical protein n=1 Tax=Kineosporia sp. NBRC 101677 TaxID=3032197 RepID=UPI0024A40D0B|nr:hypothetical protein [Kineosporia sp. NBRC 101677]GLY20130.1 hypothetical protein Kisp01_71440 [Kineosporia sp. NBRC 101677]
MLGEDEVISALRGAGVLNAVQWAFDAAVRRSLDDYVPRAGYDEQWLGQTRYVLFRDRLDRVFGCQNYDVGPGDEQFGEDELFAELSPLDRTGMPRLPAGTVIRDDLNGSPGWTFAAWRLLLTSGELGRLEYVPWSQKSPTKQAVARQSGKVDPRQGALFDAEALMEQPESEVELDKHTFVIAHALDAVASSSELAVGLPRQGFRGEKTWHWLHFLDTGLDGTGTRDDVLDPAGPAAPASEPLVKRRAPSSEGNARRASDER